MNPQPFRTPPRVWDSFLSPAFIRLYSQRRRKELQRQGIDRIETQGGETVANAIRSGQGVLLVSNHSFHYDSFVMIEAGLRAGWFAHIMTAWQVFMMYRPPGRWFLQKHGCFSVNREGNDTQAFRQAVSYLEAGPHPLLIYPEGDIYHSNDRVMPFRDGAAGIALMARKRKRRPVVIIPCAMKCFYTVDPTPQLQRMMDQLERQLNWRPSPERTLIERIYRFGSGFLALKEVEYLGAPQQGTVRERISYLANSILTMIRERHGLPPRGEKLADRIRHIRVFLIRQIEQLETARTNEKSGQNSTSEFRKLQTDMEDLFFVTQLSSYHGDYASESPSIERIAETIDKFEEDVFSLPAPTPRGRRTALVRFGTPIEMNDWSEPSTSLTLRLESEVQNLLAGMSSPGSC